ncbi:nitric oxide synthase oxygenase, partial [Lysinibacillus sp. D3C2_S12]|uniref:nitric oxide synthase oxygenase n=1 Tax=Lysinibacillus sp. D3C2_S12 TaxID=2941226 RepID=UPI0020C154D1
WNHPLIRYAGYEAELGVIGDSHSIAFTQECETLGWKSERTAFDVLPLVIKVDERAPILFTISVEYIVEVPIREQDL